jgi:RecT family
MSNDIIPFERQMVLAKAFADSKLFGITDASQALTLMALCEGQGLHPSAALADYHLIQGKPSLKADAMLARFQRSGGSVDFTCYTDEKVEATFKHPQGGSLTIAWDMKRAKQAELGGKGMWLKYPRQMLRSRVISEGVRSLFPGVLGGLYTEEEVVDMEPIKARRDFGPTPIDMKPMDTEYRDQYAASIIEHLEAAQAKTVGELRGDEAISKAWALWIELDQDEQIQVFAKFNTKQKDRWHKVESAMAAKVNGAIPQQEAAS